MSNLNYPEPLTPGDTIGIAALSSPFDREAFDNGVALIESWHYRVRVPESIFARDGFLAGSDRQRAEGFNGLMADSDIKAIICARGGYGSLRTLPYLDWDLISDNPKIVAGFSDVTALLTSLYERCRLACFHAPNVAGLGAADDLTRTGLKEILASGPPPRIGVADPVVLQPGTARAPIIGGNLTVLCHMLATPFAPRFEGHILLLEDRGEAPYRIDRMLTQMKMAGALAGVAGVALGCFTDCGDTRIIYKCITEIFADMRIPILGGFAFGHERTNLTVPLGCEAFLTTDPPALAFQWQG